MMGQKIYIILPAYNEEEGLEKLLIRFTHIVAALHLKPNDYEIIIINDGSTDHTKYVIEAYIHELNIHLIEFESNQGVEKVFQKGFSYICEHGADEDIVISLDSDNTQNPYVIVDLMREIEHHDIVIASRFCPGGKMVGAGYRAWLSHMASWVMRWTFRIPSLTDYSTFYRAYRIRVIKRGFEKYQAAYISGKSFSCMPNMLLNTIAASPHIKIAEVPLTLRYDLKEGGSHIHIPKTILGYLKMIFLKRKKYPELS